MSHLLEKMYLPTGLLAYLVGFVFPELRGGMIYNIVL